MASVQKSTAPGRWEVQFWGTDGRRRTIRLGKVTKSQANVAGGMIEELRDRSEDGGPHSRQLTTWVADLSPQVRERLVKSGILRPSAGDTGSSRRITITELCDRFLTAHKDRKPSTQAVYKKVTTALIDFFDPHVDVANISAADAQEFRAHLATDGNRRDKDRSTMAPATVGRRCGIAKQIFAFGIAAGSVIKNPFANVKTKSIPDQKRQHYVTGDVVSALLKAANPEWKAIVALCRFGGLRCPSEVVRLTWEDIDFDAGRMRVLSPKTEHHVGGGMRRVPIFPDLRATLQPLRSKGPVTPSYRDPEVNLRQGLLRLCERADVDPWPKLFVNLPASCIKDLLVDGADIKAIAAWMGNSPEVILAHYDMWRDEVEAASIAKIKSRLS